MTNTAHSSSQRLQAVQDKYLGGQSMQDFHANGGNSKEYAQLVFAGAIFGAGEDPADASLGITTSQGLEAALLELEHFEEHQR